MDWIMEPLKGFNEIVSYPNESCPNAWYQCSCSGGLLVCTKPGALVAPEPK